MAMMMMTNELATATTKNGAVFISCHRELRTGLPDHLRARLRRAGMTVYKDGDDYPKGVNMKEASRRAIQNSPFSVVILSGKYASSVSRLDELLQIKEKELMKKIGGCVDPRHQDRCLPIFYRVSPKDCSMSELAGPGGGSCFRGDIDGHPTPFAYQKEAWNQALAWLGGLSGWVLNEDRSEAEVVEQVATAIQEKLRGSCNLAILAGNRYPYQYLVLEQQGNPPPAAAMCFRLVVVAVASAFSGAAAVALLVFANAANLGAR